jgi:hypothetical protein
MREAARERAAETATAAPPPTTRSSGSSVIGCLVATSIGVAIFGTAAWRASLKEKRDQQKGDVPAPLFERPLDSFLPRSLRYTGLVFQVKGGMISNRQPGAELDRLRTSADEAYATLQVSIQNPRADHTQLNGPPRLQLGDGRTSPESNERFIEAAAQSTQDQTFLLKVPFNASWKGARLVFGGDKQEPAEMPLDGDAPAVNQPTALNVSGEARVTDGGSADATYQVLSGTLDLDSHGKRAEPGKRFLSLKMRVSNNSTFAGGFYLGNDDFRLLADSIAVAPDNFINDVISAQSVKVYEVIFMVPAGTTQADLQVGSVKGPNARIALALR